MAFCGLGPAAPALPRTVALLLSTMGGASAPFCRIQASSSAPVSPTHDRRHRRVPFTTTIGEQHVDRWGAFAGAKKHTKPCARSRFSQNQRPWPGPSDPWAAIFNMAAEVTRSSTGNNNQQQVGRVCRRPFLLATHRSCSGRLPLFFHHESPFLQTLPLLHKSPNRYDRPLFVAQPNPTFTGCRPHLSVRHLQLGPSTSHLPGTAYPNILRCSPTLRPRNATSHFSSTRPQPVSWTTPLDTGGCILQLAPPRRHDAQGTNHDLY